MRVQTLALVSGLRIQHCRELWARSQTWLGSGIAVAVTQAGDYSSDSAPSLGTCICRRLSPKKTKKKKKKKNVETHHPFIFPEPRTLCPSHSPLRGNRTLNTLVSQPPNAILLRGQRLYHWAREPLTEHRTQRDTCSLRDSVENLGSMTNKVTFESFRPG